MPADTQLIAEPADSIDDLPGRWVQPFALPGQISTITLGPLAEAEGAYDLYRSCWLTTCPHETGAYHALPTNPAIGFAFIVLRDQAGNPRDTFIIDLLWRDFAGHLVALQVRPLLPGGQIGGTAVWWKLPQLASKPAQPEPAAAPAQAVPAIAASRPDLPGVYVRPLAVQGELGSIELHDAAWTDDHAIGSYTAAFPYCLPWCFPEAGAYQLELTDALIGRGRLTVVPEGNVELTREYAVLAIWRTLDGHVTAIQLERVDGLVPIGPPFTMYRQWWTTSASPQEGDPTSCAVTLGLAQYFQIRALQCGMGACWPLAPMYATWATYYQGLAEAAGCTP